MLIIDCCMERYLAVVHPGNAAEIEEGKQNQIGRCQHWLYNTASLTLHELLRISWAPLEFFYLIGRNNQNL